MASKSSFSNTIRLPNDPISACVLVKVPGRCELSTLERYGASGGQAKACLAPQIPTGLSRDLWGAGCQVSPVRVFYYK